MIFPPKDLYMKNLKIKERKIEREKKWKHALSHSYPQISLASNTFSELFKIHWISQPEMAEQRGSCLG